MASKQSKFSLATSVDDDATTSLNLDSRVGIRELQALVSVADQGSFRAAGQILGYTQSTISHQIAVLETAFDTKLFHRPGGRGTVSLTPSGEAAYRNARRALVAIEAMKADIREANLPARRPIRIGAFRTAAAELLPTALRAFSKERPGVPVHVSEITETTDLIAALIEGTLDVAFALNPPPDERVEVIPLFDDPWVILTPRDNPISSESRPSFDVLDSQPMVAWRLRWSTQKQLEQLLSDRGINPVIVHRTDDNLALQRLVAVGLGHACVGRLAARTAGDPALTWLEPREQLVQRQISLCYPRHRETSGAVMALIDLVQAAAGTRLGTHGQ